VNVFIPVTRLLVDVNANTISHAEGLVPSNEPGWAVFPVFEPPDSIASIVPSTPDPAILSSTISSMMPKSLYFFEMSGLNSKSRVDKKEDI